MTTGVVRVFEVTDEGACGKDWIVAYTPDDALEYLAKNVHGQSVRDCRVEGLISIDRPRELTADEIGSMEVCDEDTDEILTFRQAIANSIEAGRAIPFHLSGTE